MNNKYTKIFPFIFSAVLLFTGCGAASTANISDLGSGMVTDTQVVTEEDTTTGNSSEAIVTETTSYSDAFSNRDLSGEYETSEAVYITLNGSSASTDAEGVSISGSIITITEEGTYILTGTLDDGYIVIDADKEAKVQLVLNGVSINSEEFAAIYVVSADKVFVTLADGTENTLTNGGAFDSIDDNKVNAVVFSKDDITFNGTGSLTITSPDGNGISGKDDVTITNGTYNINASKNAIRANDNLDIADGTFILTGGSDGLHAENDDDDTLGNIYIAGGSFTISATDDGIHANALLTIDSGSFDITAGEGIEATYIIINDGTINIEASDDGINVAAKSSAYSTPTVEFNGGDITIVMGAGDTDGVDSNGNIIINGGTINVTGNSTFDYDGAATFNGGTVIVNGESVTTIPNQTFGGMGDRGNGGPNGDMNGGPNGENGGNRDNRGGKRF